MTMLGRNAARLGAALLTLLSAAAIAQQDDAMSGHAMTGMDAKHDMSTPSESSALDVSRERLSEGKLFRVVIADAPEPIAINALHRWTLQLSTPDGQPVDGAMIAIDGGMPAHDHGLPTAPRMTEALGEGRYLIEGMKFQMPGHWTVTFDITTDAGSDSATFNLML